MARGVGWGVEWGGRGPIAAAGVLFIDDWSTFSLMLEPQLIVIPKPWSNRWMSTR